MSDWAHLIEKVFDRVLEVFPVVKIFVLIVLLCFAAILNPWGVVEKFGVEGIVKSYKPWLVLSALVCAVLLGIHSLFVAFQWSARGISACFERRSIARKRLSDDAKLLLCVLSMCRPDPVNFNSSAPAVRELRDGNLVVNFGFGDGYYAKFGMSESGWIRADQSDVREFGELTKKAMEESIQIYSRASGLRTSDLLVRMSENRNFYTD